MSPATVTKLPARVSVMSVPMTPTQLMVTMEALRVARVTVLETADQLRRIYPESIAHAEQLARYAEQMADTLSYLDKVNV